MARSRKRCAGWRVRVVLAVVLQLLLAAAEAENLMTEGTPDYLAMASPTSVNPQAAGPTVVSSSISSVTGRLVHFI